MIRCTNCDWEGTDFELVSKTEDVNDTIFAFCPDCLGGDFEDCDYDEEE